MQYLLPLWRKLPQIRHLLLLFVKLPGLKAKSDSFASLSGCFLFEFTSNQSLFHPAPLQMPGRKPMAEALVAALRQSAKAAAMGRQRQCAAGAKQPLAPRMGEREKALGCSLDKCHHNKDMLKHLEKNGLWETLPDLQLHTTVL